jgi:hypothetical protein
MWVITDLDNTLTNMEQREKMISDIYALPKDAPNRQELFDEFNRAAEFDAPRAAVLAVLEAMHQQRYKIAIMTGRPDKYRHLTLRWLRGHGIFYDELYMRASDDMERSDVSVKMDMFNSFCSKYQLSVPKFHIALVLEDRDKLVEMWRGLQLPCFQVTKGVY